MNRQPDVSPTAGLETPYLRASQAWDDRIGNARVQAKNWRLCALGGLLVSLAAVGGLIYQSSKSHVMPYVVEVDTQGQVRTVGPAQVAYVPSQALVQKQVSDFVRDIRVLPSDPVVLRQQWHRAYAMVTPRGGALLTALNRDQQPESKLGKHMVTVTVERALPVSDRSYDVRWRETTFGAGGEPLGTTHRSGIFQVQTCSPTTAEALQGNPLGICIDTFAWQRSCAMLPYRLVPPLLLCLLATGCPMGGPPPGLPEQDQPLVAATRVEDPPPAPPVVDVPVPLPLPAQLKAISTAAPKKAARGGKVPKEVIAQAHQGATQGPTSDGYLNSIQTYTYAPGALYQLYTRPETVSDLTLQAGETIIATAAGDTVRWVVGDTTSGVGEGQQVHVLVKPIKEGLQTNLLITTDRHVYHLECQSTSGTYMAAVSWQYPADDMARLTRASAAKRAQEAQVIAPVLDATRLNFHYRIESPDHPRWTPTRVFDDGQKTFIQFPQALTTSEAPALFLTSKDGTTQLVNYRVKGTWYIVDRLFDRAELRVGEKHPAVVRLTREEAPHGR